MKLEQLNLLYICNDFPFPPVHGGLVDVWNRLRALREIGVQVDAVFTVRDMPADAAVEAVREYVKSVHIIRRKPPRSGLLSWKPSQVAVRSGLRSLDVNGDYDVLLMQSEFVTEVLHNPRIKWRASIIRVDNDEFSYHMEAAKAEPSLVRKLFLLQEAGRVKAHSRAALRGADYLWFVSHDEMARFSLSRDRGRVAGTVFMPTAVNLGVMDTPSLVGENILFVGSLWNPLNRAAIEWYVTNVHPALSENADYRFVVAGSTRGGTIRGMDCSWLTAIAAQFSNIDVIFDAEDLTPIYNNAAVFVNPMRGGAGVKLKTVEAGIRGLPIVSSATGTEGSGLEPSVHYLLADSPASFASSVRRLLSDKALAMKLVANCHAYLAEHYDQANVLRRALEQVGEYIESAAGIGDARIRHSRVNASSQANREL